MCLHGKKEIDSAMKRFEDSSVYGVVWIESAEGTPLYGWDCIQFKDPQEVSDWVRNLHQWHPEAMGAGGRINLSDINRKRDLHGLPPLTAEGLPDAAGVAPPSMDRVDELAVHAG